MSVNNTFLADINEIYLGMYIRLSETPHSCFTNQGDVDATMSKSLALLKGDDEGINRQKMKAKSMATMCIGHIVQMGYSPFDIVDMWWTAKTGVGDIVQDADRGHPADILLKFSDGTFFGVSAKASKKENDVGFKNIGLGVFDSMFGCNMSRIHTEYESMCIKKYSLPDNQKDRKECIRSSSDSVLKEIRKIGEECLHDIRNSSYTHFQSISEDLVKTTIKSKWLHHQDNTYPAYVKVTGYRDIVPYKVSLVSSQKELDGPLTLHYIGTCSLGICFGEERIMRIRFKYNSEKMASSIKVIGENY
jgi:hypothetical protein